MAIDKKKRARSKKKPKTQIRKTPERTRLMDEVAAIVLLALGIFFVVAFHTSLTGAVGKVVTDALKGSFGYGAYFLPYFFVLYSIMIFVKLSSPVRGRTFVLISILFFVLDIMNAGRFLEGMKYGILGISEVYKEGVTLNGGGVFGMYVGKGISTLIGIAGLYILTGVIAIICLLLLTNTPISNFVEKGRARQSLWKERKAAQREQKLAQRLEEEEKNKDLEKKRKTVETAGRNRDLDYKPPSIISDTLVHGDSAEKKDDAKINYSSREWRKLSANRRKILSLMQDDSIFEKRETNGGGEFVPLGDFSAASAVADPGGHYEGAYEQDGPEVARGDIQDIHGEKHIETIDGALVKKETENIASQVKFVGGAKSSKGYKLPPLRLLQGSRVSKRGRETGNQLRTKAELLESTLASFNVEARVTNVVSGPSVTRYEIEPSRGVKVQSITRLADDLALNMRARSIRIEAPIPGKAAVGIEIENENREPVTVKEIIDSEPFNKNKSKISFAVGRDIGGNSIVADLAEMPHMLIAGATGSGKSVCINTIITSLLYKATPDEVKLVLIDPKMVELRNYNGIPHLLIPVVTDSTKAAAALQWAVAEMTDRYKAFAGEGVRNIEAYNNLMTEEKREEELLPKIVIIIDELADLMMVASSQVEDAICRLAQLARAAGMHLILATQRPSVDVITGLIKANIPSRIAFMVSSQIDSRTIIDMAGAEKLVGNGDMLYKPQDMNKPVRVQGPFISDKEVNAVIDFVKSQGDELEYNEGLIEHINKGGTSSTDGKDDDLIDEAIELVVAQGQASVSLLQRRFRIGYNRAAGIMDIMEERGIVSPRDGAKPRKVLMGAFEDAEKQRETEGEI